MPDRYQHIVQAMTRSHMVVDVVGGNGFDARLFSDASKRGYAFRITEDIVVLELDVEAVAEDFPIAQRQGERLPRTFDSQAGDPGILAARQQDEPFVQFEQPLAFDERGVFAVGAVSPAEQPADVAVAGD